MTDVLITSSTGSITLPPYDTMRIERDKGVVRLRSEDGNYRSVKNKSSIIKRIYSFRVSRTNYINFLSILDSGEVTFTDVLGSITGKIEGNNYRISQSKGTGKCPTTLRAYPLTITLVEVDG